jgi:UDP-N-acetylglucosamine--N-acetylmuramyl-(pentapeptide) pyrophosphoryl-undecaprenol N-acetylglucosamine transferase
MENKLVAAAGYPIVTVKMSGVRSKGALAWLLLPLRLLVAFWQASVAIFRCGPTSCSRWAATSPFPAG